MGHDDDAKYSLLFIIAVVLFQKVSWYVFLWIVIIIYWKLLWEDLMQLDHWHCGMQSLNYCFCAIIT